MQTCSLLFSRSPLVVPAGPDADSPGYREAHAGARAVRHIDGRYGHGGHEGLHVGVHHRQVPDRVLRTARACVRCFFVRACFSMEGYGIDIVDVQSRG